MTGEELGRKLAEACGFETDSYDPAYYSRWQLGDVAFLTLATSFDAIERDVFPVLDERYASRNVSIEMWTTNYPDRRRGARIFVWQTKAGAFSFQRDYEVKRAPTLARALAEACLAALTEVTDA